MRAADLAGDGARDAIEESAAHLSEDARLGGVRVDHDVIDCDCHVGLLVEALKESRARRVAAPRSASEQTEHRVDSEQSLSLASVGLRRVDPAERHAVPEAALTAPDLACIHAHDTESEDSARRDRVVAAHKIPDKQ